MPRTRRPFPQMSESAIAGALSQQEELGGTFLSTLSKPLYEGLQPSPEDVMGLAGGMPLVTIDDVLKVVPGMHRFGVAEILKRFPKKVLDAVDKVTSSDKSYSSYTPKWWPDSPSSIKPQTPTKPSKVEISSMETEVPSTVAHEFTHAARELMYPKTFQKVFLRYKPRPGQGPDRLRLAEEKLTDAISYVLQEKAGLPMREQYYLPSKDMGPYRKHAGNFLSQLLQDYGP